MLLNKSLRTWLEQRVSGKRSRRRTITPVRTAAVLDRVEVMEDRTLLNGLVLEGEPFTIHDDVNFSHRLPPGQDTIVFRDDGSSVFSADGDGLVIGRAFDNDQNPLGSTFALGLGGEQGTLTGLGNRFAGAFVVPAPNPQLMDLIVLRNFNSNAQPERDIVVVQGNGIQDPDIVTLDNGIFTTYSRLENDCSKVFGQRFNSLGDRIGGEIPITGGTECDQSQPDAAALEDGGIIVTWRQSANEGSDIVVQEFDSTGSRRGDMVRVNTSPVGDHVAPIIDSVDGAVTVQWIGSAGTSLTIRPAGSNDFQQISTPQLDSLFLDAVTPELFVGAHVDNGDVNAGVFDLKDLTLIEHGEPLRIHSRDHGPGSDPYVMIGHGRRATIGYNVHHLNFEVDTWGAHTYLPTPPDVDLDGDDTTATGDDYHGEFIENAGAVPISADVLVNSATNRELSKAVITLKNPFEGDVLEILGALPTGITVQATQNSLTLSGVADELVYEIVLGQIRFNNTSENPNDTPREISVTVQDTDGLVSDPGIATINVTPLNDPPRVYAIGRGGGGTEAVVSLHDVATSELLNEIKPFPLFQGEARVAMGDVNGDGVPDIIIGAGPSGGPHIKVLDGQTLEEIRSFFAFDPGFLGGVFVAAGDVNGDGFADIIVGADAGGGPHVNVFSGADGSILLSFFAFNSGFRGGARVAVGDINGDGVLEIVVGAGPGGGPHVIAINGRTGQIVASFFAYAIEFRGGVYPAAGNVGGRAGIVTGAGNGGGAHVIFFSVDLQSGRIEVNASFFAYDFALRNGVKPSIFDLDGDGAGEICTVPGTGAEQDFRVYDVANNSDPQVIDRRGVVSTDLAGALNVGTYCECGAPPLQLSEAFVPNSDPGTLTRSDAQPIFDAAIDRLQTAALSSEAAEILSNVTVVVADLTGNRLGESLPGIIRLDVNAGGIGWFIDPTPDDDEEFAGQNFIATDEAAIGRVDLLTVVFHELLHELGGADLDAVEHPNHILAETLPPGRRRLPIADELDQLFTDQSLLGALLSI